MLRAIRSRIVRGQPLSIFVVESLLDLTKN
jgi:hypothetical protein